MGVKSGVRFYAVLVSDKETINGVALAKGIKSTHTWLLFKLIDGLFFLRGLIYLYNKGSR